MDNDTQNLITERFTQLPPELQEAITHSDWAVQIRQIAKKYSLQIDQSGDLETETFLVMLGLEDADDFQQNLTRNVGLDRTLAVAISTDINKQIFDKIKNLLREIQDQENADELAATEGGESKDVVLNSIENPDSGKKMPLNLLGKPKSVIPSTPIAPPATPTVSTVSFVDHLLAGPTSTQAITPPKTVPPPANIPAVPSAPEAPQTRPPYSVDPYREPIE